LNEAVHISANISVGLQYCSLLAVSPAVISSYSIRRHSVCIFAAVTIDLVADAESSVND